MADYEGSTTVNASADDVFAFVSDVQNLPKYLPTTKSAEPQQGGRVRVQGRVRDHTYDADGYFRKDEAQHRLEWGADERHYSGWLEITEQGGSSSTVTVHLTFNELPPPPPEENKSPDEIVNEGIADALQSIKNQVEGHGGKVEPPVSR